MATPRLPGPGPVCRAAFVPLRLCLFLLVVPEVRKRPEGDRRAVEGGGLRDIVAEGNRDDLRAWARAAIEDIDARRTEFVDSLHARETALLIKIDDAFARTIHANANVTAHLKSLLKVEEMQDRVLQATGLKELRDEITDGLA